MTRRFLPLLPALLLGTTVLVAQQGGSVRSLRQSQAVDSSRAIERLVADIRALITLPDELKANGIGIEVRSLTRGGRIFELNPDHPLTPASTTKLVTTYTALSELGTGYTITTQIVSPVRPVNGVVRGNLWVVGHGDPFLSVNDIDQLVDQVVRAGVTRIEGGIVGDGTFFDEQTQRVDYSGDEDVVEPLPPIEALTIQQGVFTVVVSSPSTPGAACNVQTVPPSAAFMIANGATVAAPGKGRRRRRGDLQLERPELRPSWDGLRQRYGDAWPPEEGGADQRRRDTQTKPAPASKPSRSSGATTRQAQGSRGAVRNLPRDRSAPPPATPAAGPIKVSVATAADGRQTISVSGTLPPGKRVSYRYRMKSPPTVIAGMLTERLRRHGVVITAEPTSGSAPQRSRVIAEVGRPLVEILNPMMKNSDNFLAEYVFKMIGGAAGRGDGTAERSVEKITARMSLKGIDFSRCVINDGSGLSRRNCLSAAALAGILATAHEEKRLFDVLYASMSVAGVDGTLRKRMRGTPAEGNVHAKTGTLRNSAALTGYVTTRDGELLCFGMLMNGSNLSAYRQVQDKILQRLAAFSYSEGG